jgi:hypothetical protein
MGAGSAGRSGGLLGAAVIEPTLPALSTVEPSHGRVTASLTRSLTACNPLANPTLGLKSHRPLSTPEAHSRSW